jgi:uroporphyrinogen-III decarboxylase
VNSRERILAVLNGEIPDRVPYAEIGGMMSKIIAKHYGSDYGAKLTSLAWIGKIPGWRGFYKNLITSQKTLVSVLTSSIDLYKKLGMDAVPVPVCLFPIPNLNRAKKINGKSADAFQYPKFAEYVDEYGRYHRYIPSAYDMDISFFVDGVLTSEEIYDAFGQVDPHNPLRMEVYEASKKIVKDAGENNMPYLIPAVVGINEVTWEGLSYKFFARAIKSNKPFIRRVLDDRMKWSIEMIKDLADHGAETVLFYDDYGYKEGPLVNPKDFKEEFKPRLKQIVDAGHKRNIKMIMHSCGNLNLLWDDIMETGIDALHPLEPTARMDIFELKRKTPKLTFIGNVSPQDLQDKSPEFIRNYTTRLMTECKQNGHYILSSGHSINPAVSLENYLVMREVHEKMAAYK